ncbi:lysophospholipase L2 [Serratia marcescens]|nr:lysophospholipase L2 [Serratia marcescens]
MLIIVRAGNFAVGNTDNVMERCALIDFDRYVEQAKSYGEWSAGHADMLSGRINGLSYRLYRHTAESEDVIVVYHGGGVNSAAGYDVLARQLAAEPTLAVCLVDIRGHGDSTGERGTVERPERIWRDVDVILAEMRRRFPLARRHLLGHSSGAGMLLNYLTRYPGEQQADSLILLAPELGPFSGMARDLAATARFAQVRQWPFVANALSGGRWFGHARAVSLNFPPAVLAAAPDFVCQYSVNMANALTPRAPAKQLAALRLPTLLLAAAQDELFSAQSLQRFVERHGNVHVAFGLLEGSTHLSCVFDAHRFVLQHITRAFAIGSDEGLAGEGA